MPSPVKPADDLGVCSGMAAVPEVQRPIPAKLQENVVAMASNEASAPKTISSKL